jgi:exosortase/archaeosortase family protein
VIRLALSLAAVFGLVHLAGTVDVLSEVTRPIVVAVLGAVGIAAADQGDALIVGRLVVPWTRDCAGLNALAMLWAVILWVNRAAPLSRRMWAQLLLAVPVAFVANLARILTLIAFRSVWYPAVEGPQLHYFIGFLWVMPTLGLWTARGGAAWRGRFVEALYLAALLALLAPHVGGPGGSRAALAALVVLAKGRFDARVSPARLAGGAAWLAAGGAIASAGMESLWVPWMLVCPWVVSPALVRSWSGIALLAGTVPLVAMHPVWRVAVIAGLGWEAWRLARRTEGVSPAPVPPAPASSARWRPVVAVALALAFTAPFVASAAGGRRGSSQPPPPGAMARRIDPTSYALRLVGQSPDIELAWFDAAGDGRHHTLPVCMRFRGVILRDSSYQGVMTDGGRWMKEFFLHDGTLLADYPSYLRRTFLPFSSPGVHLVFAAPVGSMSASLFAQTTENLARQLGEPPPAGPTSE